MDRSDRSGIKNVCVIGQAALPCGRFQTPDDAAIQTVEHEILADIIVRAVADAGIGKSDIDSLVFTHPRTYTKQRYFATFMANYLRLRCSGVVMEVIGNGMTGGLAFDQAVMQVASGVADVALALGISVETAVPRTTHLAYQMRSNGDVDFHAPFGFTPRVWYGMDAARYFHEHGATREELAAVAVKDHWHGSMNPLSIRGTPFTKEQILAEAPLVDGMGLLELAIPADGAICLVLAREEIAKSLGRPYARVSGRGFYHEGVHEISEVPNDMLAMASCARSAEDAFAQAGIGPRDVSVAELYAGSTIIEVLASEAMGFAPRGKGARAAVEGETRLGGRIPINTSGAPISRGHPAYLTPLYGVYELVEQLRGGAGQRQVKDAGIGVMMSELGNFSGASVHVLEAGR